MVEFDAITIRSALTPVSVVLQPLEFETRHPSFRCQANFAVEHPTGRLTYEASNVWFGTEDFDQFLSELSGITRGTHEQARLRDLSNYVVLTVTQRGRKTSLSLSVFESLPKRGEARLSFTGDVDADYPATILAQLRDYDRWWKHKG
jgi:hypothetical protein